MIEVGVVLDTNEEPIYWHVPNDSSIACIPDSRDLWDVLWENRDRVSGFAHTHPVTGRPWPSATDLSTFVAIENALGKSLQWWIVTLDKFSLVEVNNTENLVSFSVIPQPWDRYPNWISELRRLSRIGDFVWKTFKHESM